VDGSEAVGGGGEGKLKGVGGHGRVGRAGLRSGGEGRVQRWRKVCRVAKRERADAKLE